MSDCYGFSCNFYLSCFFIRFTSCIYIWLIASFHSKENEFSDISWFKMWWKTISSVHNQAANKIKLKSNKCLTVLMIQDNLKLISYEPFYQASLFPLLLQHFLCLFFQIMQPSCWVWTILLSLQKHRSLRFKSCYKKQEQKKVFFFGQ